MVQELNPNTPDAVGIEWRANANSTLTPSRSAGYGVQRFHSTAAETVDEVQIPFTATPASEAVFVVDVTASGDEACTDIQTTTFVADAATLVGGATAVGGQTATDLVSGLAVNRTDYVLLNAAGEAVDVEFPVTGLTGRRILGVTVLAQMDGNDGAGRWGAGVNVRTGATDYLINGISGATGVYAPETTAFIERTIGGSEITPVNAQPWITADLAQLDGGTHRIRFAYNIDLTGAGEARIQRVRLQVTHCAENRVARGAVTVNPGTPPANDWQSFPLGTPAGIDWSKANNVDYALIFRQALNLAGASSSANATITIPYASTSPPMENAQLMVPTVSSGALTAVTTPPTSDKRSTAAMPFVLLNNGAAGADYFPYRQVQFEWVTPSDADGVQQNFTAPQTTDFVIAAFAVGWDSGFPPDNDLTLDICRVSDDVVVGTTTITRAWVLANGVQALANTDIYEVFRVLDTPAALVNATGYYWRFTTGAGQSWVVTVLWTAPVADGGDPALSFGGSAQRISNGGVANTERDLAGFLAAEPDPPSDLAASAGTVAVVSAPQGGGTCLAADVGTVDLAWTNPTPDAAFSYWEVQRFDDRTNAWETVARLYDSADDDWTDLEPRLGVESTYRVRQVTTFGTFSEWTATSAATATSTLESGLTFTSNQDPTEVYAYMDIATRAPERDYRFPEADEVEYQTIYGRDYVVEFHPIERRGVAFERQLLIDFLLGCDDDDAIVGPSLFDAFRAFVWSADYDYIAVRDENGNRWYMSVVVPSGLVQGGSAHSITALMREVVGVPAAAEVTV